MKIAVIGCGRWGSFITWYLNKIGHDVLMYGREESKHMKEWISTRSNQLLTLNDSVVLSTDITDVLQRDVIVISVNSQGLRELMKQLSDTGFKNKKFVLCMKGIEIESGERLTEIVSKYMDASSSVAVWLGPGHVQEFYKGVPNCMVIDSTDLELKEELVNDFSSDLIRFYYGSDLIGNEIGAASKNVIGIAAGMLDGLKLSSLKGALMSRGTREIARLISAMGGNELSAYGLCHLGDYEATVFSTYSHNRKFGEAFVTGEEYKDLAEGYYTVKALLSLSVKYKVELPICNAVYAVLYENKSAEDVLGELFLRSLKEEF
ncbi:MAG: NAD-dependent glycerol-3-phosphate dehydrogenase domain protein [Lachnospiraceae bacterium]|jgi:glycerol-3-phosphate dehydrogenase (NAD(P)+)|nr:NAD-dependent glycerol-3-phosphate dehydrogenase domain protein [Lachnospiraceae bacterium]